MSRAGSVSSSRVYGAARVMAVWNLPRSSFYATRQREWNPREPRKRGPKVLSDPELRSANRGVLEALYSPAKVIARSGRGCATVAFGSGRNA